MADWHKKSISDLIPGMNSTMLELNRQALEKTISNARDKAAKMEDYINNELNPQIAAIKAQIDAAEAYLKDFHSAGIHYIAYDKMRGLAPISGIPGLMDGEDFASETAVMGGMIFLTKGPSESLVDTLKAPMKKVFNFDDAINFWDEYTIGDLLPDFNPFNPESMSMLIIKKLNNGLDKIKKARDGVVDYLHKELYPIIEATQQKIDDIIAYIDAIGKAGYYTAYYDLHSGASSLQSEMESDLAKSNLDGWCNCPEELEDPEDPESTVPNPDYVPPLYPNAPTFYEADWTSGILLVVSAPNTKLYNSKVALVKKVFGWDK